MFIDKEIILVLLFLSFLILGLFYLFYNDFNTLIKHIRDNKDSEISAEKFFFFSKYENLIYNINLNTQRFQKIIKKNKLRVFFFNKFFDNFPDPLLIVSEDFKINEANKKACDLLGPDLKDKNIYSILRMPALRSLIIDSFRDLSPKNSEVSLSYSSNRYFNAWVSASRFSETKLLFIRLYDTTAEKKTQVLHSDFVANASHELKTPIAVLSGYCETLLGVAKNDKKTREKFLLTMKDETQRMSSLVNDLLSLSRIERIEHTKPEGMININSMLKDIKNVMGSNKTKKKNLIFSIPKKNIDIPGDYEEIRKVILNIIDNALKYGQSKKSVEVKCKFDKEFCDITVQDFGQGIPKEDQPLLTNRFFRSDDARSRGVGSTGLGLSIVKHTLNRHGGQLNIESELKKGSKFTIKIPANRSGPEL